MKIKPINNTNFQSKIVNNNFFTEGVKLAEKSIFSSELKDMNFAKNFYDNINRIKSNKQANCVEFILDTDKRIAYTKEDGIKKAEFQYIENFQPGYILIQTVKKYVELLNLPAQNTHLDSIQQKIVQLYDEVHQVQEQYRQKLIEVFRNIMT